MKSREVPPIAGSSILCNSRIMLKPCHRGSHETKVYNNPFSDRRPVGTGVCSRVRTGSLGYVFECSDSNVARGGGMSTQIENRYILNRNKGTGVFDVGSDKFSEFEVPRDRVDEIPEPSSMVFVLITALAAFFTLRRGRR